LVNDVVIYLNEENDIIDKIRFRGQDSQNGYTNRSMYAPARNYNKQIKDTNNTATTKSYPTK